MTKTFTIALLACAIAGTAAVSDTVSAASAQQTEQQKEKEKAGGFTQPTDPQPVMMPAGQRPEEWKFQREKERDEKKAVEDKKAAKKKAEEDKKLAAEAKKKADAESKLASKAAKEDAEKKRVEERRAADDKKKAEDTQRLTDARAEREAAVAKRAEEQKAADERRALERRAAAEKASEGRKAEAEKAAEAVREKEEREAEKKAVARQAAEEKAAAKNAEKAASRKGSAPPVAAASDPAPAPASSASAPAAAPASVAAPASSAAAKPASAAPAPASQKTADAKQAGAAKPADGAKQADGGKPAVDPVRPPAVIRSGDQPDAWKMSSEKPRAEGAAAQGSGKAQGQKEKSSDTKSASTSTGQSKPSASTPPKPKEPWRGWSDRALISLNAGWQSASFDLRDTRNFESPIGDREQRTLAADYSVKSGMSLDLGGGYRVWRALAAGVSVTRFSDSQDVSVSGSIPHPFFFNRARAISGVTAGAREEMAVHVNAMWVMPIRPKMTLAVFGGPSFYSVKQTVVSDYDYNQTYPYDDVTLTRVVAGDESTSVTGINVGADVGYYFTETIGVGGVIRFGRATVDTSIGSLDVGGPEFGVGLRIRIPQGRPRGRAITPQPPPTTR